MNKTKRHFLLFLVLAVLTLIIYGLSYNGDVKHLNYFVPLADAFLHGRLYLTENPAWLNELITIDGRYYVVYPPMPAILLVPIVALLGRGFEQPYFSIFIGSINVGLCYLVLFKLVKKQSIAFMMALLFGFGTMHWYHAQAGSAWYIAHIIAIFFIWLMLLESFTRKRYWLIGLLIGCAYWSRLPAILAITFPVIYYYEDFFSFKKDRIQSLKNWFLLFGGVVLFIVLNAGYNYLRFGVPYDISYSLLPIFNEPWYQYGLFNIRYVPIHLQEIFTAIPTLQLSWPYFIPSLHIMALWFVTPALLLIVFARFKKRIALSCVLSVLVMSLPGLFHGSNGFTQFGFRFALDYLPFLIILIALGMRDRIRWYAVLLFLMSLIVNGWGIYVLNFLELFTM